MKRNNIILLAFLAVLIVVFMLSKCKDNIEKRQPMFSLKQADIQKFEIISTTDTLIVAMVDNVWMVTHPRTTPAKDTQLQKFFDEFLPLTISTLSVTDNPEKQALYGVDEDSATKVILYGKNDRQLSKAYVGTSTNNPQFSYIRAGSNSNIYQIDNVRAILATALNTWREDRIITLPPESVLAVTFARENDPFTISMESGFWTVAPGQFPSSGGVAAEQTGWSESEPTTIDPLNTSLSSYLNTLTSMRTSTVYYDSYEQYADKLANPALGIQITSSTKQIINLTIAQNDANSYVLQKDSDTSVIYRLTSAQYNQLNVASAGFHGQ